MGSKISTQKSKVVKLMINDKRTITIDGDNLLRVDRFAILAVPRVKSET